jgi:hypothetical protein
MRTISRAGERVARARRLLDIQQRDGASASRLCFDPRIAVGLLHQMMNTHELSGRLVVLRAHRPIAASVERDRIKGVLLRDLEFGVDRHVEASFFVDGTPWGGSPAARGSRACVQSRGTLSVETSPRPHHITEMPVSRLRKRSHERVERAGGGALGYLAKRAVSDSTKALLVAEEALGPQKCGVAREGEHVFVRQLTRAEELAVTLQPPTDGTQAGAAFDALVAAGLHAEAERLVPVLLLAGEEEEGPFANPAVTQRVHVPSL